MLDYAEHTIAYYYATRIFLVLSLCNFIFFFRKERDIVYSKINAAETFPGKLFICPPVVDYSFEIYVSSEEDNVYPSRALGLSFSP